MKAKQIFLASLVGLMLFTAGCQSGETAEPETVVEPEVVATEIVEENTLSEEIAISELEIEKRMLEASVDAVAYSYVKPMLAVDNGKTAPGAQMIVVKDGEVVFQKAYGVLQAFDIETGERIADEQAVTNESMFDLASCTKISATTQAIMKLVYEGKVDPKEPVATYLPGYEKNGKENVTVEQLLTHTSGLPQWVPMYLYCDEPQEVLAYISGVELIFEPGTYKYSDLGFMSLGFIVESVTGQKLDAYVEENIYKPLGMEDTVFNPLEKGFDQERISVSSLGNPFETMMIDEKNYPGYGYDCTEHEEAFDQFDGWRKRALRGEVNDGNAGMGNQGVAGHAGLFSTAEDLSILYQMMLNGGEYNGVQIYDQATIDQFIGDRQNAGLDSYGFRSGSSWMKVLDENAVGHNGFTGQYIVLDQEHNIVTILLTNKMNAGQKDNGYYSNLTDFAKAYNNAVRNVLIP